MHDILLTHTHKYYHLNIYYIYRIIIILWSIPFAPEITPRNVHKNLSLIKLSKFSSKSLSSFLVVEHSEDVWAFVIVPVQ